jgi:hypothetical protein
MRRVERLNESLFGIENSSVDPNKFYSILLDARAASVSENMCDIAEKLLTGEKDNAKGALEQLWRLKKNLFSGKNNTIDLLIDFYQEKMEALRTREERLRKVSLDSRNLLEEKRRKDEEVATVKQQVADCTRELNELTGKLDKLKIKEQELTLIEHQLREELNRNENEIVNGLYEIILAQQEQAPLSDAPDRPAALQTVAAPAADPVPPPLVVPDATVLPDLPPPPMARGQEDVGVKSDTDTSVIASVFEPPLIPPLQSSDEGEPLFSGADALSPADGVAGTQQHKAEIPPYPKSVVKTTGGRVIGEYYYDGKIYKNERHYIFNTDFFANELLYFTKQLRQKFDLSSYTEMLQMIQDAAKRITENKRLHFEVATNEILNDKTIKRLYQDAKLRSIEEVERFGTRLRAKIDAQGGNYQSILREQMQRCIEKT